MGFGEAGNRDKRDCLAINRLAGAAAIRVKDMMQKDAVEESCERSHSGNERLKTEAKGTNRLFRFVPFD